MNVFGTVSIDGLLHNCRSSQGGAGPASGDSQGHEPEFGQGCSSANEGARSADSCNHRDRYFWWAYQGF